MSYSFRGKRRSSADAVATITYEKDGEIRTFAVGCHATRDGEEAFRWHLELWAPGAVFIKAEVKRVRGKS